jgi:hypothetical protein
MLLLLLLHLEPVGSPLFQQYSHGKLHTGQNKNWQVLQVWGTNCHGMRYVCAAGTGMYLSVYAVNTPVGPSPALVVVLYCRGRPIGSIKVMCTPSCQRETAGAGTFVC